MLKFLEWWYTDNNGNEYMSLLHCALNDKFVVYSILVLCLGIVYQYGDIAYRHFINYKKYPSSKLSEYFIGKTKVFVVCLIAGYAYRILSIWVNPYKLLILVLAVLNLYTYRFRSAHKELNVFYEIHELERKFGGLRKEITKIQKSIIINLFGSTDKIKMIPYSELNKIEIGQPFDSDGSGTIENTRIEIGVPCFSSTSVMRANSYIEPHQHDTDKILKCVKGAFYDNNTEKWYKEGEYLIIPKANQENDLEHWHDIKTGEEETHLQTFIFPKQ